MNARYQNTKKGGIRPWTLLAIFAVLGAYYLWASADTTPASSALAEARQQLGSGDLEHARSNLMLASKNTQTKPWALFYLGELARREDNVDEAQRYYSSVPQDSAASLQARLALLDIATSHRKENVGTQLSALESDIRRFEQLDLLEDFRAVQAQAAEHLGDIEAAHSLYQGLRASSKKTYLRERARSAIDKLRQEYPKLFLAEEMATVLADAKLLLREGNPQQALETAQRAKEKAVDGSEAYLEALLFEERIVRSLGRHKEADHILLMVSADGSLGTADKALLSIARKAWNINDHQRALEFIEKLEGRFPESSFITDAHYVKARVLEEQGASQLAKDVYRELTARQLDSETRLLAHRRLAWLHMKEKDYSEAVNHFQEMKELAEQILEQSESLIHKDHREHAIYWHAIAFSRKQHAEGSAKAEQNLAEQDLADQDSGDASKVFTLPPISEELLQELILNSPSTSYYRMLAFKELNKGSHTTLSLLPRIRPVPGHLSGENSVTRQNEQRTQPGVGCLAPRDLKTERALRELNDPRLADLLKREIHWRITQRHYLADKQGRVREDNRPAKTGETIGVKALTASLLSQYHNPKAGIRLSIQELRRLNDGDLDQTLNDSERRACYRQLLTLAYPQPYRDLFEKEAERSNLSASVLLAITRTESHFDSYAISRTGAQGLMQLMPKTAQSEGLEENQDIYNPKTNIALGAKHLSRLYRQYSNAEPFAIAAYNAGSGPVNRWRDRSPESTALEWIELIGYPETYNYVRKVLLAKALYEELGDKQTLNPTTQSNTLSLR